ncbi:MAG: class I SAM-dependent DNA methyltransferase [Candidatus Thorarchaeota archaeon]
MRKLSVERLFSSIENKIKTFEKEKYLEKAKKQNLGIIYTPKQIVDYIVSNNFRIYFERFESFSEFNKKNSNSEKIFLSKIKNQKINEKENKIIQNLRILDPSCGSGRFLAPIAEKLYQIYRFIFPNLSDFELKRYILQNNLFGIEIDKPAIIISKLRLIKWVLSTKIPDILVQKVNLERFDSHNMKLIIEELDLDFNIFNIDFLLDFNSHKFDMIIGNPPYVENKKIKDIEFKREITERFKTAYRLFDLSILFIEKSLELLENKGILSFILSNKFLSADYGIKIRTLLLNESEIKEIVNISSLPIFQNTAAYPIILFLIKDKNFKRQDLKIKIYNTLTELVEENQKETIIFNQNLINQFPSKVIPVSGNIELTRYLYSNFKTLAKTFPDLKIIYRPFGFLKYRKHFDNISEQRQSKDDLLLIGTGNIGKYHIKFNKRIKIARKNIKISYFNYNSNFKNIWSDLNSEKLIFREIAKDLTCYYDPGIFCNITGLYFIKVASLTTDQLFALLTILNSELLNDVFKTLFSTLHMAGGYLRFNGSFIKRLPMPSKFPASLSQLGKILQLLSQLKYDLNSNKLGNSANFILEKLKINSNNEIKKFYIFFNKLSNSLVNLIYLDDYYLKSNSNYFLVRNLLDLEIKSLKIPTEFLIPHFNINSYKSKELDELFSILDKIKNIYGSLNKDKDLINQINKIIKKNFE